MSSSAKTPAPFPGWRDTPLPDSGAYPRDPQEQNRQQHEELLRALQPAPPPASPPSAAAMPTRRPASAWTEAQGPVRAPAAPPVQTPVQAPYPAPDPTPYQEAPYRDPRIGAPPARPPLAPAPHVGYDLHGVPSAPRSATGNPFAHAPLSTALPPQQPVTAPQPTVTQRVALSRETQQSTYPPVFDPPQRPPVSEPRASLTRERTSAPPPQERASDRALTPPPAPSYEAPPERPLGQPMRSTARPQPFSGLSLDPPPRPQGDPRLPMRRVDAPPVGARAEPRLDPRRTEEAAVAPPRDRAQALDDYPQDYLAPEADYDSEAQEEPPAETDRYADDLAPEVGDDESYYEEGGDVPYDEEPPPRSGGFWSTTAATLSGIAVVCGVLAYGYVYLYTPAKPGETPVVKGDPSPAKSKPEVEDGKKFAHADSAVMKRLRDGSLDTPADPKTAADEAEEGPNAARRVKTFAVSREGEIVPPAPPPAATLPESGVTPQETTSPMPGLVVATDDPLPPPEARTKPSPDELPLDPAPAPEPKAKPKAAIVTVAPPAKPTLRRAPPVFEAPPAEETAAPPAVTAPPAPAKKTAVVKKPTPPSTTGSNPGTGFMAVIASVPATDTSRDQVSRQFSDMQQKYASVLQDKTFDVREADLADKGKYHRLMVGPPGSKEEAASVCQGLKTAGFTGCWVAPISY